MSNGSRAVVPSPSAPTWKNWSGNLVHEPATDGVKYYFMPANLAELQSVLADPKAKGVTVRVTGQRHSQTPLVIDDNRNAVPTTTKSYLVDMSCYKDLGPNHDQSIVLVPGKNQVTVNAGVREDELDAFLTKNNLMLKTVTAGGFFSLGGMTAVDVHGGTMDAPIFAETVSAFTLVLADGAVKTIDQQSPAVGGWSPLQFARVSLGSLGVVTSVTIDVIKREYATTLQGETKRLGLPDRDAFIRKFTGAYETRSVGDLLHAVRDERGRRGVFRLQELPRAMVGCGRQSYAEDPERRSTTAFSSDCVQPRWSTAASVWRTLHDGNCYIRGRPRRKGTICHQPWQYYRRCRRRPLRSWLR